MHTLAAPLGSITHPLGACSCTACGCAALHALTGRVCSQGGADEATTPKADVVEALQTSLHGLQVQPVLLLYVQGSPHCRWSASAALCRGCAARA